MLKAVRVLGFVRTYGTELLHTRPISTSLYRASSPAAAKGVEAKVEQAPVSSFEKCPETASASTEESNAQKAATESAEKPVEKTDQATEDAEPEVEKKGVFDLALQTTGRVFNCKQVLKSLALNKPTLTDRQMASLISIGGSYRGSSIVSIRRQYLTNLLNIFKEQGQKPGILAMNAVMAAKLDNDETVDAVDFLQQLENKQLELNNTSYELIARTYAKTGNVNAILSILSHLKDEDNLDAKNPLLNWLAYAEGMNGNVENVGTIARASKKENYIHSACLLYLNAALGLAKKGELDVVEQILSRTKIYDNNVAASRAVIDIYMAFLSQKRLDALEKLSPYLKISQETGCITIRVDSNQIACYLDTFISEKNFDAFEQVWKILPKGAKETIRLQNFPAKNMLDYALKLMDEGKSEDYKTIIDAFRNSMSFPNSDDFFFYFIEEYFKRQNKPIDAVEAFSIYMKVTQREGDSKKRSFHHKTISHLLRLSLSTYKLARAGDSQKHIYDIILDTIEENIGKEERNFYQQQVLTSVIGGRVASTKKPVAEKKVNGQPKPDVKKKKRIRNEVTNLLEPSAV